MNHLHLNITQEDIQCGTLQNGRLCPIARALQRSTGATQVCVAHRIEWTMPVANSITTELTPDAEQFILACHGSVPPPPLPFFFGIIPEPTLQSHFNLV